MCGSLLVGAVLGILVISHWILDVITHRPDLPIWPEGPCGRAPGEVSLCVAAHERLAADGIGARVVSMPSWELFERQGQEY